MANFIFVTKKFNKKDRHGKYNVFDYNNNYNLITCLYYHSLHDMSKISDFAYFILKRELQGS